MATVPSKSRTIVYPSRDGRPIGETPVHRDLLVELVHGLQRRFAGDPMVYVSGNMLVYYVPGDKRRHVSPDVWMARGVPNRDRDYFLIWEEPRGPEMVIELTSRSTRQEDLEKKFALYRDVLRVSEYFLFDPRAEYLDPPLRGFRLIDGQYVPIQPIDGRFPSEVAGVHLVRDGQRLVLYDPVTRTRLLTVEEALERADAARQQAEAARQNAEAQVRAQDEELERLRRQLDDLRRTESSSRPAGE
ncbi:MAG: Uma2 family endonuclease [Isosphaeraceae bacterium]|nr:Uma2 family endonuclease [Isosphaeraceae bacterium]